MSDKVSAIIEGAASLGTAAYGHLAGAGESHRGRVYARWLWHEQQAEAEKQRQWNLDLWNMDNEYNSPAAQRDRLIAAGYSPMAFVNGSLSQTQPADGGNPASMSALPQQFNPAESAARVGSSFGEIGRAIYDSFVRNRNDTKRLENETKDTDSRIEERAAYTNRVNQLLHGEIELQGTVIELNKSRTHLNEQEVDALAVRMNKENQEIENLKQYLVESGARVTLMDIEGYCKKHKLNAEIKQMMCNAFLSQQQAYTERELRPYKRSSLMYSNRGQQLQNEYVKAGRKWWKQNYQNEAAYNTYKAESAGYQSMMDKGHVKSEKLYIVDNAFDTLNNVVGTFGNAARGFMFWKIGKSKAGIGASMLESAPNGANISPYPSKRQLNPTDGYSLKQNGWMPSSYFE